MDRGTKVRVRRTGMVGVVDDIGCSGKAYMVLFENGLEGWYLEYEIEAI